MVDLEAIPGSMRQEYTRDETWKGIIHTHSCLKQFSETSLACFWAGNETWRKPKL